MSDTNPNDMTKYCCDCKYFKKIFPFFLNIKDTACERFYFPSDNEYKALHPKYDKKEHYTASWVRTHKCGGKYWEPKG